MQVIETPTCNIRKSSGIGKVLRSCQLIIWDECTMAHKKSLEALNRTLQDLRGNEQLFDGALILLAGDFQQTPSYTTFNTCRWNECMSQIISVMTVCGENIYKDQYACSITTR
ncbi:ATP-dependent DNA helicase [Trichonephila clavipes]|nr:ATP-dependent DNA helicase [Trichonephila clavipes]